MNLESGFAPEIEKNEIEVPEPRHLADILQLSVTKIREMPPEELQRLHDEMVPHLSQPEKPSAGFTGYLERLNPVLQRQIAKKPELAEQHLQTYLATGLTTLRSRVKLEQQPEKPIVHRETTGGEKRFIQRAGELLEENFSDWGKKREVVDRQWKVASLTPEDQSFVNMIDTHREVRRASGEMFTELTDRYEVGFAQGLERYEVFGKGQTTIHPTSKYDDYARGVDMIARIKLPGEPPEEIVLGIDFTISSTDIDLAKKLRRNREQPTRQTKYDTRRLPKNLKYLPVVLSVDRRRAERASIHEAYLAAADENSNGERLMATSRAELEKYHDEAVFKYTILEEAIAQLHVQRDEVVDRQADADIQHRYDVAISYFENLLGERKNLQVAADLETKQDEGVYRVANEEFIRSAPKLVADVAASRAA